jgi:quinone-modifying oxidoreductase subunit QmoB
MEKVGAFVCTGCEIGESLNLEGFEEIAEEQGATHYATHPCLCSEDGVALIHKAIDDGEVDGVLIAACSPRVKKAEFRLDPVKAPHHRVALREHAVWTHKPGDEDTQMIAEDILRMGVVRMTKQEIPKPLDEQIERRVLVVGGGYAGLHAAQAAAGMGCPVTLVEKQGQLGGYLAGVKDLVPEHPPYDQVRPNDTAELIASIGSNADIDVITGAKIKQIDGQPGQFDVQVEVGSDTQTLRAGAIVQATGASPYDASKLSHLGYGQSPDVITGAELEQMILKGELTRPSDGAVPGRIAFVQCAGSRDEDHLPYCSSECCATTLKQIAAISRDFEGVECAVIYKDMRTPGQMEHFYLGVQESSGAMLTRGEVAKVEAAGGKLQVGVSDSLLGEDVSIEADLVVLATGMVPRSADGEAIRELVDAYGRIEKNESESQVAAAQEMVDKLKPLHEGTEILNLTYRQGPDLPVLKHGFPDSHYICFPYETRRTGIYAAGAVHAPMDSTQAAEDGWGAALKAVQSINANERGEAVHPRAGDIAVGDFFLQRCTQCKRCTEECPFGTLNEDVKGTPEYFPLRCRRCGICLGACPERIVSFPEYSVDAVGSMIKAIEVPEEYDEKPRTIAILCENDALPALDKAAEKRVQWNPWVRIVPIRCLGAANIVWIADSLSRGIDGVILIGCKSGDDYQCHYIRGSELAGTRLSNVAETLERLTLEPERVKVVELSHDEFERIPQILDEFAETIDEVGPNPYKGF